MMSCYQNHAAGFMCKPFDFEVFQQKFNLLARYWAQSLTLFKQTTIKTTKLTPLNQLEPYMINNKGKEQNKQHNIYS
jgi:hypothetical protein